MKIPQDKLRRSGSILKWIAPAILTVFAFQNCTGDFLAGPSRGVASVASAVNARSFVTANAGGAFKMVDSTDNGYGYAYGPSIIFANGAYHAYYCSSGPGNDPNGWDWDHVRHVTSGDLVNWSPAVEVLTAHQSGDRSACDPSVVLFNAGDGAYFYILYSGVGTESGGGTANFIARAASPDGPFLKRTKRGTWEVDPADAQTVVGQFSGNGHYGAGQGSLVSKNGVAYQWYMDDTGPSSVNGSTPRVCLGDMDQSCFFPRIYLRRSSDMVNWSPAEGTNVFNLSVDVKYDDAHGVFVMSEILNEHTANASLALRTSSDGITWSDARVVCDSNCLPA